MNKKSLLKHLVPLMFFIFLANHAALKFHWYFSIWYSDMFMHFLGGVWLGLFFTYVFYQEDSFRKRIPAIIVCAVAVGILWEVFEFVLGVIAVDQFNILDTTSDIFFDLSGGLCAILYVWKK